MVDQPGRPDATPSSSGPNVKFHDGKPFTSADVAYSIQLLKTVHPRGRNTFANVIEVQTPDPLTAVIVLSKPAPYLIKALTAAESPMVPKHIYEGTDPLTNQNGNAPIGTGPYMFKEWVRGSHVDLRAQSQLLGCRPAAHRPHGLQVRARRRRALGRLRERLGRHRLSHAGGAGRSRAAEEAAASRVRAPTARAIQYNVQTIQFNLDSQFFKHLKVRQAVAHAIDRTALLKTVAYGYGTVDPRADRARPQGIPRSEPSPYASTSRRPRRCSTRRASSAAPTRSASRCRSTTTRSATRAARSASSLRAALGRIGITVEVRAQDLSAFTKRIYTDREFDFTYNGHSNLFDPTVGVQRIYWSKNFKKGVPFSNGSQLQQPQGRCAARGRRGRERSGQAQGDVHGVPEDLSPRTCRTSASTRRSISRSRTSACTRIR